MAKKPRRKVSSKVKSHSKRHSSKYNKFQRILSEYKQESGVDFKGKSFNSVAATMWKKSKDMPLHAIRGSIDILFDQNSGINPPVDISGIPQNVNYWALKDVVSSLSSNLNIIIDNSIFPGISDYKGTAGNFIDTGIASIMTSELNRFMKENFPREAEERYSVYISEVEPDGSVKITLSSSTEMAEIGEPGEVPISEPTILPPKEKLEKLEKPDKPRRSAKEEKEISAEKLKVIKGKIKLEKQKERSAKQKEKTEKQIEKTLKSKIKLAEKALQLKKAGFSKSDIIKILGK